MAPAGVRERPERQELGAAHQRRPERPAAAMTATPTPRKEAPVTVTEERKAARAPRAAPTDGITDRARHERRLGWYLSAPPLILMLAVTAYPMLNALYLSLFSYRLTDPSGKVLVGLGNYGVVLSDPLWWEDVFTTFMITLITVAVELVIGFTFAMVMHRILFGRRTVRTSILVPYGIITV